MKKTLFVLLCLLISLTAARGGDKITTTNPERLPVQARKFLSEHFSDTRISIIKIEPKGSATTYDVLMENGVAVAFNHKGMRTEMDAKVGSVPQSAIPADILQYARDRFPGCEVQAAKRDGKNTEIKLSNRTELMFNAKGEPIDREKEPRDD